MHMGEQASILRVFAAYLRVMRRLQTVYMLEPAGSHGVWGLDDYHCLVFLWGAWQLVGKEDLLTPEGIHRYAHARLSSWLIDEVLRRWICPLPHLVLAVRRFWWSGEGSTSICRRSPLSESSRRGSPLASRPLCSTISRLCPRGTRYVGHAQEASYVIRLGYVDVVS